MVKLVKQEHSVNPDFVPALMAAPKHVAELSAEPGKFKRFLALVSRIRKKSNNSKFRLRYPPFFQIGTDVGREYLFDASSKFFNMLPTDMISDWIIKSDIVRMTKIN